MLSTGRHTLTSTYSVEVSGWDNSHSFFVERSELTWQEETGKFLTLSRRLSPGTMVFVRMLQPTAKERTSPVAYRAELVSTTPEGHQKFLVKRMEPRNTAKGE